MTEKIISNGIIIFVVSLALVYLNRSTRKPIEKTADGEYILRMNKLYGITGIVCFILGFVFIIFPALQGQLDAGMIFIIALMLLMFWGMGIPCWLLYKNHRIKFDENKIQVRSISGKETEIQWPDIKQITFSFLSSFISITDNKEQKIKIHLHIVGLATFIKMMESKTKWRAKELKLPIKMP